jgi:ABC-type Fe3+/spermidine/putrescine transport system ATPase subunit
MGFIEIRNLLKRFGKVVAVDRITLEIEKGEIVTLLGPSGCGKTTTLRCIAGLERPDEGDVVIDGRPMFSQGFVPPSKRGIGMVFQNYAVWPHMRVFDNVAYGLKIARFPKKEIRRRVLETLKLVGLEGLENRYPTQLSGGQQQRVALARALTRNPKVLLLDEPLSNLDAKLREKMRFEIQGLVKRMGITAVYVTHDQAEAMVISDRVAVMNQGRIVQVGSPEEIYHRPATKFVADFIGVTNFISGMVVALDSDRAEAVLEVDFGRVRCTVADPESVAPGKSATAFVRPEDVEVVPEGEPRENTFGGTVLHRVYLGNILYLFVQLGETSLRVQGRATMPYREGDGIRVHLDPRRTLIVRE